MAYDATKPAGGDPVGSSDEYIRENFRALLEDQIVNAGKLKNYEPGNAAGNLAINNSTLCVNLNADMVDGYHAGNASGNIPISNGTLNANLNAAMLNGQADTYYRNATNINAGTLDEAYGGTGQSSYTKGDILAASDTSTLNKIGVGANNTLLMADSSQASGVKWGSLDYTVGFGMEEPANDERSVGFKLPRAFTATALDLLCATAPSSAVTVQIYKNGVLLDSNTITTTSSTKAVNHALAAGDVLYAKISGGANSIAKLTAQLKVNG